MAISRLALIPRENEASVRVARCCSESENRKQLLFRDPNGSKTFDFHSGYEFIESNSTFQALS